MEQERLKLAADFPPVERATWRKIVEEKELKGFRSKRKW